MTRRIVALGLALALVAGACGEDPAQEDQVTTKSNEQGVGIVETQKDRLDPDRTVSRTVVEGINGFGYDYYGLLANENDDGDIVLSPLSIATVAAMLYAGARGPTASDLASVFGFPTTENPNAYNSLEQGLLALDLPTVRTANRLYPAERYPIEQHYVDLLAEYFGANVERLDFSDGEAAAARINQWVSDRTEGLIDDLVSPDAIGNDTELALVNALYLAAAWAQPFPEGATEDATFTRLDGGEVSVPMMHAGTLGTYYAEGDGWQAVELPYEDPALSMLVIVPEAGRFADVEDEFDADFVAGIDDARQQGIVDLRLPKWSSRENDPDLLGHLADLGFDATARTDFTGIGPDNPQLTSAVHAATITVDEKGTVAAAATAALMGRGAPPRADVTITADRPYLYVIRHTPTGTVLFAGRVVDPSA